MRICSDKYRKKRNYMVFLCFISNFAGGLTNCKMTAEDIVEKKNLRDFLYGRVSHCL